MAVNVLVPFITRLLLENDQVRVYEFDEKPGEKTEMHEHPDYVAYALTDSVVRITTKDGRSQEIGLKSGEPVFRKAQSHVVENIGKTEARFLLIDLKR